jgi:hypothetical protein
LRCGAGAGRTSSAWTCACRCWTAAAVNSVDAQLAQVPAAHARDFQYDAILALIEEADPETKWHPIRVHVPSTNV